jgi:hypothetical protein
MFIPRFIPKFVLAGVAAGGLSLVPAGRLAAFPRLPS